MNSRIIVKNLPSYLKENELKKIFSEYGDITDVRILFRKNKNRRFGYIGYKYNESAKNACEKRNDTYINTYKIVVEYASLKNNTNNKKLDESNENKDNEQNEEKMKKYKKFLEQMNIEPGKVILEDYEKNENTENPEIEKNEKTEKKEVNLNIDYSRLYVTNLPYNCKKDEIREIFEKYGEVIECKFPINNLTNKPKGFAFIKFEEEASAINAYNKLDNTIQLGRIIHIKPSFQSKYEVINSVKINEKSSYKKLKKMKLLEKIKDQSNWNSLFINPNLVIDRISSKLGIEKRELLDKEFDDLPVKVSLAELEIINETKEWLSKIGANMELFKGERIKCKRSNEIIIVKNLNYDITKKKLEILFNKYGQVKKLQLADNKSIAIVEYYNEEHCSNVFKNLQEYETYGTKLFLEYAPVNLFIENNDLLSKRETNSNNEANEDYNTTVFVKNLNFKTTEATLEELLNQNELYPKKISIKNAKNISQGFGFLEFETILEAKECIKKIQNVFLDDHNLNLTMSKKKEKKENIKISEDIKKSNKLIIKNIPFETTKQELRELFKKHCIIKSLRLPKKMDGSLRGFCFLELMNIEDATFIKENFNNIHSYGRNLKIEFSDK